MTVNTTGVRGNRLRGALIVAVVGVFILLAQIAVLYAAGVFALPSGDDDESTTISVSDDHVAFTLEAPADTGIYTVDIGDDYDGCDRAIYKLNTHGLVADAVSKECTPDDEQIINGNHGTYRTIDDVPEPKNIKEVTTGLGPAKVFTQEYDEYTNVHTAYEEPVAIVTFDEPVNPDFPTLVLRSSRGELDRDAFTEIVASLGAIRSDN